MDTQFMTELEQSLESLTIRCRQEAHRVSDIKSRVILETASEVFAGLLRALHDSQLLDEADYDDEGHIFSPKSSEPWD
jgi:hypothetical protein